MAHNNSHSKLDPLVDASVNGSVLYITSRVDHVTSRSCKRLRAKLVDVRTRKALCDTHRKALVAHGRSEEDKEGRLVASYRFDCSCVPPGVHVATVSHVSRKALPLCASFVAVALLIAAALLLWHDPNAQRGNYAGKTEEEIARDLDAEVDWWSMEVSIKPTLELAAGQRKCEARIENIAANHCDQVVTLELASTGETIYRSGAIHPGEYIQDIELMRTLPVGTHDVVATFQGYEQNLSFGVDGALFGHERFGASCSAQLKIVCNA